MSVLRSERVVGALLLLCTLDCRGYNKGRQGRPENGIVAPVERIVPRSERQEGSEKSLMWVVSGGPLHIRLMMGALATGLAICLPVWEREMKELGRCQGLKRDQNTQGKKDGRD